MHRAARILVSLAVGLGVSFYAFHRVTDVEPGQQRAREEAAVGSARAIVGRYVVAESELQIVDPLAPNRAIGKVYVYPAGSGFEVSGYYRRDEADKWHPFLMRLGPDSSLVGLSVRDNDAALLRRAASDPRLDVNAD